MLTAAPPLTVYQQLEDACLPLIEAFHNDLIVHDRKTLEDNPGMPFLHWTRDTGTNICMLEPADAYPPKGKSIPYLFGHSERGHILKQTETFGDYHTRPANNPGRYTCHHFDGVKLRKISLDTAVDLCKAYARRIRAEWDKAENKPDVRPDWY